MVPAANSLMLPYYMLLTYLPTCYIYQLCACPVSINYGRPIL